MIVTDEIRFVVSISQALHRRHIFFFSIYFFFFIYIKQSILVLTTPYRRVRRSTKYSIECQLSHLGHSLIQIRIV